MWVTFEVSKQDVNQVNDLQKDCPTCASCQFILCLRVCFFYWRNADGKVLPQKLCISKRGKAADTSTTHFSPLISSQLQSHSTDIRGNKTTDLTGSNGNS